MEQKGTQPFGLLRSVSVTFVSAGSAILASYFDLSMVYAQVATLLYVSGLLATALWTGRDKLRILNDRAFFTFLGIALWKDRGKLRIRIDRAFFIFLSALFLSGLIIWSIYCIRPTLKITSPADNSTLLDSEAVVSGSVRNQPRRSHVWLLVYHYSSQTYYPQCELAIDPHGNWKSLAQIPEGNEDYDIWVVFADDQLSNRIAQTSSFNAWRPHPPRHFAKIHVTRPP